MIQKGNSKEIIIKLTLSKHIVITLIIRDLHSFKIGNYKLHKLYSFLNQILKKNRKYILFSSYLIKKHKLYYNLYFVHFLTSKTTKTLVLHPITTYFGVSNRLEFPYNLVPTMEVYNDF